MPINLKNKRLLLFLVLLFFSVVSFIYLTAKSKKPLDNINTLSTPTPTKLELVSVFPLPGKSPVAFRNTAITFVFNQELRIGTASVDIQPEVKVSVLVDAKDRSLLHIVPKSDWNYNTKYQMTVSVKPFNGLPLDKPVSYEFEPTEFTSAPNVY
ncbi:MAG: Ig-like domain-containing protein [Patescibacteria group bacterium]